MFCNAHSLFFPSFPLITNVRSTYMKHDKKDNEAMGRSITKQKNRSTIIAGCVSVFAVIVMVTAIVAFICIKRNCNIQSNPRDRLVATADHNKTATGDCVDASNIVFGDVARKLMPSD